MDAPRILRVGDLLDRPRAGDVHDQRIHAAVKVKTHVCLSRGQVPVPATPKAAGTVTGLLGHRVGKGPPWRAVTLDRVRRHPAPARARWRQAPCVRVRQSVQQECSRCHPDACPTRLAQRPIVSRAAGLIPRACRRAAPIAIEGWGKGSGQAASWRPGVQGALRFIQ